MCELNWGRDLTRRARAHNLSERVLSDTCFPSEVGKDEKREMEHQRDEAVHKFDRLQETLRSLESFAEDTVCENKAQKEKIAERDSHMMILSETCRDIQVQLTEPQDSQIKAEVYSNNVRANIQAQQIKSEEVTHDKRFHCLPIF